jgi:predicted small metal-binding protein
MTIATCECGFTATSDTREEAKAQLVEHAETVHPEMMTEMAALPQEEQDAMLNSMLKDA